MELSIKTVSAKQKAAAPRVKAKKNLLMTGNLKKFGKKFFFVNKLAKKSVILEA
jgi:hypothetical protein